MGIGKRKRHAKQASMWLATHDMPRSAGHPFYARLNQILDQHEFDGFVEGLCERFCADAGRPGLPPGRRLTHRAPVHKIQANRLPLRLVHQGRPDPP
jgi:transposase